MSNTINYPIPPLMLLYSIERLEKERLELLNDALAPEVFCKLKKCAAFLNPVTQYNKHEFLQEWTNSLEWDDTQKSIMNGTYKGEIIEPRKIE
tara:strand:+ start:128 stop:406 length:279 start_codon:yes stop_codon:yes gene_type:complete